MLIIIIRVEYAEVSIVARKNMVIIIKLDGANKDISRIRSFE